MSAVIDRPHGLTPTIGGSTYVKPSEMDWKRRPHHRPIGHDGPASETLHDSGRSWGRNRTARFDMRTRPTAARVRRHLFNRLTSTPSAFGRQPARRGKSILIQIKACLRGGIKLGYCRRPRVMRASIPSSAGKLRCCVPRLFLEMDHDHEIAIHQNCRRGTRLRGSRVAIRSSCCRTCQPHTARYQRRSHRGNTANE